MKRNPDLERQILPTIEADTDDPMAAVSLEGLSEYADREQAYHVLLLHEAGLVDAIDASSMSGIDWIPTRLTMAGHQYLETIRDPEVWRQTKESAEKIGSFSLDVLSALAKGFLRTRIKSLTGYDVEL